MIKVKVHEPKLTLRPAKRITADANGDAAPRTRHCGAPLPSETIRERFDSELGLRLWAVGLIDGDGHIGLEWTNAARTKWVPLLKVSLHVSNARAIHALVRALGVGRVGRSGSTLTLRVRSRRAWRDVLLPYFLDHPLRTVKAFDVTTVARALAMSADDARAAVPVLKRALTQNKLQGNPSPIWGLSGPTHDFSTVPPAVLAHVVHDDWLAGFVEAEGSFYITRDGSHGFALGQAYDTTAVAAVHARFGVVSRLKFRPGYVMVDTKRRRVLNHVVRVLTGRCHGMKGIILRIWARSLRRRDPQASAQARRIIRALVKRDPKLQIMS